VLCDVHVYDMELVWPYLNISCAKFLIKLKKKNTNSIHIHQLLTFSFLYYLPTCSKFDIKKNPPGLLHIALSALGKIVGKNLSFSRK